MPIVRISSVAAAVGSRFASRMGARGAVTSATPTADLSHPIASQLVIGTDDSVLVAAWPCTAARRQALPEDRVRAVEVGAPGVNGHRLITAASMTCRRGDPAGQRTASPLPTRTTSPASTMVRPSTASTPPGRRRTRAPAVSSRSPSTTSLRFREALSADAPGRGQ
jgi:hypothetical protein